MLPQRFYVSQQHGAGDRHVYASRTRFIPNRLLTHFEQHSWPAPTDGPQGKVDVDAVRVDLAEKMRSMWR
jgi:DNA helicase-2/ATP-dependent DNA helicase PcrA